MNKTTTLIGCDVSHWNKHVDISDFDFFIHKATEGKLFCDNMFKDRVDTHVNKKPFGLYHFAQAYNNNPIEEVDYYLKTIKPYIGKCAMVLDFEGPSLHHSYSGEWLEKWLETVKNLTDINPMLYISENECKGLRDYIPPNTPLWIANWTTKPKVDCVMWQYMTKPVDLDMFFGDLKDFKKLYNYYG